MRQFFLLLVVLFSLIGFSCGRKPKNTYSSSTSPSGTSVSNTNGFFATPVEIEPKVSNSPFRPSVMLELKLPRKMLNLGNNIKMELLLLPSGIFQMGSTLYSDEHPIHTVDIAKAFYLGVTEVTQAQYQVVMGSNPSHFQGAQRPVENVTWNDAVSFCEKLSQKSGKTVRLPTEAEWEYACQGLLTAKYCFGNDASQLGQYAWFLSNSQSKTHIVRKKKPNGWGLYDMHGNVKEWCQDHWSDGYSGAPNDGSAWTAGSAGFRMLRGGSWLNTASCCRATHRDSDDLSSRNSYVGFRVVVSLPQTP